MSGGSDQINRTTSVTSRHSQSVFLHEPYRTFQVFKSSAQGLGAPLGFQMMIHPSGGSASTPSPAYHTSKMWWTKQLFWLPGSFSLFDGGSKEIENQENREKIGSIKYRGVEGLVGMKCDIEVVANRKEQVDFMNQLPDEAALRHLQIKRMGMGREYEMRRNNPIEGQSQVYMWKGTKSAIHQVDFEAPECNGNLKMVDPQHPERILAVWKNRTDFLILGALLVLEKFDEGRKGMLEEVVLSCLAIVIAERLSARGWLGGWGKTGKTSHSEMEADSGNGQSPGMMPAPLIRADDGDP